MDADINLISKEGSVKFFGEEAFSAEFHKRFVQDHVTLCFHYTDFNCAIFLELIKVLHEECNLNPTTPFKLSKLLKELTAATARGWLNTIEDFQPVTSSQRPKRLTSMRNLDTVDALGGRLGLKAATMVQGDGDDDDAAKESRREKSGF